MDSREQERVFLERLGRAWGRPALTLAEVQAFDRALAKRLANPRRRKRWVVGAVLAAATSAALALALVPRQREAGDESAWLDELAWAAQGEPFAVPTQDASSTTTELAFLGSAQASQPVGELGEMLPEDYRMLAALVAPPDVSAGGAK